MERIRKPKWLKIKHQSPKEINYINRLLGSLSLNTVCQEANCPNRLECFSKKTATFMILGKNCSRNCKFCNVSNDAPTPVDVDEPQNLANAVKELGLKHVVITSVTRDDLEDGGSSHFKKCIEEIKKVKEEVTIETLIPDFKGNLNSLKNVIYSDVNIINHNIETTRRLTPVIRDKADYDITLKVLSSVKELSTNKFTKSGIMLGLGETKGEVIETLNDLRAVEVDFVTIGQYLQPSKNHLEVKEYITPEQFKEYEEIAYELGFKHVASGPFVRSSYNAGESLDQVRKDTQGAWCSNWLGYI